LTIHPSLQVTLCDLTQLKVLRGNLSHKLIILLKPLSTALPIVKVVVELHSGLANFLTGTHTEARHAASIQVEGADGEEKEEESVIGILGVGDVPGVGVVVVHFIEGGWVFHAEGAMGILAMEAFLIAVDHGLPVEASWVLDGASMR
jgi:hypothetical protein